jgi:glycine cleavage system H protein
MFPKRIINKARSSEGAKHVTPEDRNYMPSHEWVKIEGDIAIVGITDHAQETMGDITYIELPELGHVLAHDEDCGVIESVKAASDIRAPGAGKVVELNAALEDRPELVNEDPYGKGWMFKISDFDPAELEALFDATRYEAFIDQE